jgi:hypothetical protein
MDVGLVFGGNWRRVEDRYSLACEVCVLTVANWVVAWQAQGVAVIITGAIKQLTRVNLLVTRCTNKFNIQQLYGLPTLYLCVV